MILDLDYRIRENGFILRNFMYNHKNGLTVGKAAKATAVAALAIWEKARIYMYAHFAQHVDSGVFKIRTLYDSYSLQKKNRLKQINIFIDSNEALNKLFNISQKDLMNSITNDKSREQALSSNAVGYLGRSCKYVSSSS